MKRIEALDRAMKAYRDLTPEEKVTFDFARKFVGETNTAAIPSGKRQRKALKAPKAETNDDKAEA